jgi:hypothetical protein
MISGVGSVYQLLLSTLIANNGRSETGNVPGKPPCKTTLPVAVGNLFTTSYFSTGGGGRTPISFVDFLGMNEPAPTPTANPATKTREGPIPGIVYYIKSD